MNFPIPCNQIINRFNKIEFRNFFNQMGAKETLSRMGVNIANGNEIKYGSLRYEQRSIYSGQVSGKHTSQNEKSILKWLAGFGYTNRNEPDFRRYLSTRSPDSNEPFKINLPATPNSTESSRFSSKLNEYVLTGSVNHELALNEAKDEQNAAKLRTGVYVERKDRTFVSRIFGYKTAPQGTLGDLAIRTPEELFAPENVDGVNRLAFEEGTDNEKDAYKATNLLIAPYASLSLPISAKFSATVGVRFEYNDQQLLTNPTGNGYTQKQGGKAIGSLLPSLNLTYNLNDKSLLRLAYSSSINRPEFRELALFRYYEPNLDAIQFGNNNLTIARIQNVDLRWELYPTQTETITFGAFYKYFSNPIENQLISTNGQYTYSFAQAKNAQNYGIETEIRKNLTEKFTVVLNASYIISNITNPDILVLGGDLRLATQGVLPAKRPMYGQSPYLINAGVFYNDDVNKLQFSLLYNVFGRRLFAVGNITDSPSQYEMPRHGLDFTVSKGFKNGIEIRFGAQDLLNPAYRVVEDSFYNGKSQLSSNERNANLFNYKRGQYFTLALNYKF